MISGRIGCELAVMAVLCVLMIFLFPAIQGPYSVVHGPATAFQAARTAARLRAAILRSALSSLSKALMSPLVVLTWMSFPGAELRLDSLPEHNLVLRC